MYLLYSRKYGYTYSIKRNGKNGKKVYKHRYFYFGSKKSENTEVFFLFSLGI